ncbi:hypothetical protein HPB50_026576 [Hyalomma asiaticum]|uniref:Uncharacterized protein n=1 Tax=Hyalomma asiaticum TaxID=266040 RepID=A0ACB7TPV9_HYAAI|nr:hypothetical protein HPB50_026576 [Hyalomma asiaticum]
MSLATVEGRLRQPQAAGPRIGSALSVRHPHFFHHRLKIELNFELRVYLTCRCQGWGAPSKCMGFESAPLPQHNCALPRRSGARVRSVAHTEDLGTSRVVLGDLAPSRLRRCQPRLNFKGFRFARSRRCRAAVLRGVGCFVRDEQSARLIHGSARTARGRSEHPATGSPAQQRLLCQSLALPHLRGTPPLSTPRAPQC